MKSAFEIFSGIENRPELWPGCLIHHMVLENNQWKRTDVIGFSTMCWYTIYTTLDFKIYIFQAEISNGGTPLWIMPISLFSEELHMLVYSREVRPGLFRQLTILLMMNSL